MEIDGEVVWQCPRRTIKDDPNSWGRLLRLYSGYKNGMLPFIGGTAAQPAKIMMAFAVLDEMKQDCDEEKQKRKGKS